MCYKSENELYNEGIPFKITCRDESGVVVTIIADNYFGYSKKEVKTQVSYAANLYGLCEEEHAGGTIAFPRKSLGEIYSGKMDKQLKGFTFEDVKKKYGNLMELQRKTILHLILKY